MMDQKKADPREVASPNATYRNHFTPCSKFEQPLPVAELSTNTSAQRQRLLDYLRELGPITTIQARDDLNIIAPAARIIELREQGHKIDTLRVTAMDSEGRPHPRVGLYVYRNAPEVSQ